MESLSHLCGGATLDRLYSLDAYIITLNHKRIVHITSVHDSATLSLLHENYVIRDTYNKRPNMVRRPLNLASMHRDFS